MYGEGLTSWTSDGSTALAAGQPWYRGEGGNEAGRLYHDHGSQPKCHTNQADVDRELHRFAEATQPALA
jgi:transposase InsO family protein